MHDLTRLVQCLFPFHGSAVAYSQLQYCRNKNCKDQIKKFIGFQDSIRSSLGRAIATIWQQALVRVQLHYASLFYVYLCMYSKNKLIKFFKTYILKEMMLTRGFTRIVIYHFVINVPTKNQLMFL